MAGITNRHMHIRAIDPPRSYPKRRWQCVKCGHAALLEDLRKVPCSFVYEPCEYCGSTGPDGDCALDCAGILAALGQPGVAVIGGKKPILPKA